MVCVWGGGSMWDPPISGGCGSTSNRTVVDDVAETKQQNLKVTLGKCDHGAANMVQNWAR